MVQWSNYQMALWVTGFYVGAIISVFLPDVTLKLIAFWGGMVVTIVGVFMQPTVMKLIARGFKQIWVQPESDENTWAWEGRIQLWHKRDPAQTSEWLADAEEWQTFIPLEKPIHHPFYNNKKKIYGVFMRHGISSFDNMGRRFSAEEKKKLGIWDELFPSNGGWVVYGGCVVWSPSSDWCVTEEIMPSSEEITEGLEALSLGENLINHVPMIVDGIAYPVLRVKRAVGSRQIEKRLREEQALLGASLARKDRDSESDVHVFESAQELAPIMKRVEN